MTKPNREPDKIPSGQQASGTPQKVTNPSGIESGTKVSQTEHNHQKGQKTERIRKYLRELGSLIRKVPPISYLTRLHNEDRGTFWIAIFSGALVYFTWQLVVVTKKVDETTRLTQRAFVTQNAINPKLQRFNAQGKWAEEVFLVQWENSGNTPIKHGTVHSEWHKRAPSGFDFSEPIAKGHTIMIGAKDKATSTVVIPTTDMELSLQHKERLYIWGWLTYDDVFFPKTPKHLHEFCAELVITTADFSDPKSDLGWVVVVGEGCQEHNCDDEDCADYEAHLH